MNLTISDPGKFLTLEIWSKNFVTPNTRWRCLRWLKIVFSTKSKMCILCRNAHSLIRVERKILLQVDISNFMEDHDHVVSHR
jgi:hypothetical protein